jgi:hypothetical protein
MKLDGNLLCLRDVMHLGACFEATDKARLY